MTLQLFASRRRRRQRRNISKDYSNAFKNNKNGLEPSFELSNKMLVKILAIPGLFFVYFRPFHITIQI